MFKKFDAHTPYFRGVAMAIILCGAAILALSLVELAQNLWGTSSYSAPMFKMIGGFIVISLGYIQLELELMRIK